jgi:flavorubredoxin
MVMNRLLKHNVTELLTRYRDWSQAQTKAEKTVAVFYISDYGYQRSPLSIDCQRYY